MTCIRLTSRSAVCSQSKHGAQGHLFGGDETKATLCATYHRRLAPRCDDGLHPGILFWPFALAHECEVAVFVGRHAGCRVMSRPSCCLSCNSAPGAAETPSVLRLSLYDCSKNKSICCGCATRTTQGATLYCMPSPSTMCCSLSGSADCSFHIIAHMGLFWREGGTTSQRFLEPLFLSIRPT